MTSRPGSPTRHDISSEAAAASPAAAVTSATSGLNVPTSPETGPDRDPPGLKSGGQDPGQAQPEQEQAQVPLTEPDVPTTISADNFEMMMDYWRVQADKQE